MALATKCPHCNTTFRVAHDQLKLRGGIVRCGACNEVFDGNAALVDPVPPTPVIIDLPDSVHDTAPAALATGADSVLHAAGLDTGADADADASLADAADAAPGLPVGDTADLPEHAPASQAPPTLEPRSEHELGDEFAPGGDAAHEPGQTATPELEPAPSQAAELLPEPDLDLDLNGDEAPAPTFAADAITALPALSTAQEDAFDLDLDIDVDTAAETEPVANEPAPEPAAVDRAWDVPEHDAVIEDRVDGGLDERLNEHAGDQADNQFGNHADSRRADGRREPTLDIPDEHLAAVALHDSFELDAYPRVRDDAANSAEEHGHTLDDGVWRNRAHGQHDVHHLDDDAGDALGHGAVDDQDGDDGDDIVTLSTAAAGGAAGVALAPEPSGPATPVSAREPEEPGFVKRSRRKERWGKASRIAMAGALPLLLAGLAYQAVATFRNPLAAAIPALKPALVSACAMAGCKVDLPTQLDALSIDQGELQTLADNIFSFATSLRNQSATAQSWPHIELILNDSADKPVLRRVFAPREYLPPGADQATGFLPRSEQPVKLYFELSRVKASGYHIAVFYP